MVYVVFPVCFQKQLPVFEDTEMNTLNEAHQMIWIPDFSFAVCFYRSVITAVEVSFVSFKGKYWAGLRKGPTEPWFYSLEHFMMSRIIICSLKQKPLDSHHNKISTFEH